MSSRLTRGRLRAAGVAVVALAVASALAIFAGRWWEGKGGTYAPRHMVVHTAVTPRRSLFGQVITATVRVVVDPRRIDPRTVRVVGAFRPWAVRSEQRGDTTTGRARVISFQYSLQCLVAACVPRGGSGRARSAATAFTFRPALVTAQRQDGSALRTAIAWPTFGVQSRLTAADLALGEPQVERPLAAPSVTWRISPNLLGGVASVLAILFVLGSAALIASVALVDGRPLRPLRIPANLTPVDRALALAAHAAKRGETEESRKALERLAAVLRREGAPGHADDAERLAWSADQPTPENVALLADSVRSNGAR
jgi:hypothetical protein